jgi:hypothetical protein
MGYRELQERVHPEKNVFLQEVAEGAERPSDD